MKVGVTDRRSDRDVQTFEVESKSYYDDFNPTRLSDNIAVLYLKTPIDLLGADNVNAACLPQCTDMFDHVFQNGTGTR